MIVKKSMDSIEGEKVARHGDGNRPWTQIDANLDGGQDKARDVFGGTPNTAVDPSPLRFDATRATALSSRIGFRAFTAMGVHSRFDAQFLDLSASAYASR